MRKRTVFAVIMAGGKGERLWPLSNRKTPKPFLKFKEMSLLQDTASRIEPLVPIDNIYVVTGEEFKELVYKQLPRLPKENVIAEPFGRGTAPCIGLAAIILEQISSKGVMIALSTDHAIKKTDHFLNILKAAIEAGGSGEYLITLGIVPDHPATGYGYIRCGEIFEKHLNVHKVQRFTEKPDEATARKFLQEGKYLWNSGIFIWRVDTILAEIKKHMPELYKGLIEIKSRLGKPDVNEAIKKVYQNQKSISIDYGVLEKSSRVLVIPADIGWSDIGDWTALEAILEKNGSGNIIQAKHLVMDTKDSIIFSSDDQKLIATIGLENVVIIDAGDALLVMDKKRAQEVREMVKRSEEGNI